VDLEKGLEIFFIVESFSFEIFENALALHGNVEEEEE